MEHACSNKVTLFALTLIGFLVSLQLGFTNFLDSTYLSKVLSPITQEPDRFVGYVFALSAALTLIFFIATPRLLRRFGATKLAYFSGITLTLALFTLAHTTRLDFAIPTYLIVPLDVSIIFTLLDVYISQYVDTERLGFIHGIYFAGCSLGYMLTPAIAGFLATKYGLSAVYLAGMYCVLPVTLIFWATLRGFKDPEYENVPVLPGRTLRAAAPDLVPVFAAQFALQTFYGIMTIYIPLFFAEKAGVTSDALGYMLTIALALFVIMPTPLGWLADNVFGEKELTIGGIVLMGLSLVAIPFFAKTPHSFFFWATVIFVSRIGAASTESMADAFFFKRIEHTHPSLIAFYRRARPLSLIVVPALGASALAFGLVDMGKLITYSGVLVLATLLIVAGMRDTR